MAVNNTDDNFQNKLEDSIRRLLDYCNRNNWAGYDPFDGLSSRIFACIPFSRNRLARLFFIQFMKRFPLNLRRILQVPMEQNPKGIALFVSSLIKLQDCGFINNADLIASVLKLLIKSRTKNSKFYCWGYNFDWQNRGFFLPKFTPNIICTTFAANALLDFYEKYRQTKYLDIAVSAGQWLLSGLNITKDDSGLCLSYTPFDSGQVHNASLLGAALLARLYSITAEKSFHESALQAVHFSIQKQNADGSWPYGEDVTQQWVDNFHTGYNLVALARVYSITKNGFIMDGIRKGYDYYKKHLFTESGIPKYFDNRTYPIDIHSIAQSIITPIELANIDRSGMRLSETVFRWAYDHMQNKEGYFYYQQGRFLKNRIPYMRWSQAWMFYALSVLIHFRNQSPLGKLRVR